MNMKTENMINENGLILWVENLKSSLNVRWLKIKNQNVLTAITDTFRSFFIVIREIEKHFTFEEEEERFREVILFWFVCLEGSFRKSILISFEYTE